MATRPILMDEKALRKRINDVYTRMRSRAKPKLYRSGGKAGKIRTPGLESLPFTAKQLWSHAVAQIGYGAAKCPYCERIGRPVNLISLATCVFDHKAPIDRGGGWTLDNLVCVCADCNNCKGKLSFDFFIALMTAIEEWPDQRDRTNIHMCLRTHGVTMRYRFAPKDKPRAGQQQQCPPEETMPLAMREDW